MAKPLTNADFKSLLNETDASLLANVAAKRKKPGDGSSSKERKRPRPFKPKKDDSGDKHEEVDSSYVDRAAARRAQKEDYKQVETEFQEMKSRSIDESKYLGGDLEHTHLVKGLDYQLLNKIRQEIDKEQRNLQAKNEEEERKAESRRRRGFQTAIGRSVHREVMEQLHPHHVSFNDKLKRIDDNLMKGNRFRGNTELFLPGRMAYCFDTQMDMEGQDIPTFIHRSKEDCPAPPEGIIAIVQKPIREELNAIYHWHAENRRKKRHERLSQRPREERAFAPKLPASEAQAAAASHAEKQTSSAAWPAQQKERPRVEQGKISASIDEDDDDIFQGAGHFDPKDTTEHLKAGAVSVGGGRSYFDDTGAEEEEEDKQRAKRIALPIVRAEDEMEVDEGEGAGDVGLASAAAAQEALANYRRKEQERKDQEALRASKARGADEDSYMECYPSYNIGTSHEIYYDSDDEEGKKKKKDAAGASKDEGGEDKPKKSKKKGKKGKKDSEAEWKQIESMLKDKDRGGLDSFGNKPDH
ncbi:unnamed protein product [Vitrella brassicaformis CCMP3155]|uniref:RED-like N-terminal domain-containing protein n=2 Tax=Vitrella brassicaformis TaxID=1169539 RepID=A0A0G4EBB6_VITBC|nr:unnamed protein product [Vitrella brassicaformis CCMP3155]|mmetsp:Transcript_4400/g.10126  ORF Transcript_4400/g.10126 Transcript_4400/m.10126 type:complete len:527 (+) Transcript_4400:222-1802(+)|eukprot:CEL92796.1 unnamed protein product [Vitrella brassicaformis CCMP3155]